MLAYNLLIQLLLVNLPCTHSSLFVPIERKAAYLSKIIRDVHKERPIETFLILKRSNNQECLQKNVIPQEFPTLRLDESIKICLKKFYNSEALVLVCMSDFDDVMLLNTLADNINRMREARIIVWMYSEPSIVGELMGLIGDLANTHNFVNLLVLQSSLNNVIPTIPTILYRLQPFPSPTFQRITDINRRPIFIMVYRNFNGKSAIILPDLLKPKSFLSQNPRTGKHEYCGSSDRLLKEFAKKHNIKLELHIFSNKVIEPMYTFNLTVNGGIDLPIRYFAYKALGDTYSVEYVSTPEIASIFIVIPCGQEMSIGDMYRGLRSYSIIILGAYFIFAIIETFSVAATFRIFRGKYYLKFSSFFVNLRVFSGILGLPIHLNRYRSSISLQQIVLVLSFFGFILSCYFNANLSTLLTKQPYKKSIGNFKELYASGLPLAGNHVFKQYIESEIDSDFINIVEPNITYFSMQEAEYFLLTLNTSYAHVVYSKTWKFLNAYQKKKQINALCESPGLIIANNMYVGGLLKNNSVFRDALNEFVQWAHGLGLIEHWDKEAGQKSLQSVHHIVRANNVPKNQVFTPLRLKDFKWLCKLMGFFYGVSIVIFICEILLSRWQNKRAKKAVVEVV